MTFIQVNQVNFRNCFVRWQP